MYIIFKTANLVRSSRIHNRKQWGGRPRGPGSAGGRFLRKGRRTLGKQKAGVSIIIAAIVNGAGIGLLLGVLPGLSISLVVSGIIGILSGLLAVLLGTSEKYMSPLKSIQIGAFGFCCVAGIML